MIQNTTHKVIYKAAQNLVDLEDKSIDLVVTSPPYPMIQMWDEIMGSQDPKILSELKKGNGYEVFELMHQQLDIVWKQLERVLKKGGFACINIGDATRTIDKEFRLYPNHSRIISGFLNHGFSNLPNIIWRKQTNAPNKFMGSGMLPAGAYVTLEHEWILIFRNGNKRTFKSTDDKLQRRESAMFWEERNSWFSDLWDLKGTTQKMKNSETRKRSGAYPIEIPYRLINMYSVKGDTILDPFLGTGTTSLAALASERNSIGYEIDKSFKSVINKNILTSGEALNSRIRERIIGHNIFVDKWNENPKKNSFKYSNESLKTPVITRQEKELKFSYITSIEEDGGVYIVDYESINRGNEPIPYINNNSKKATLF